MKVIEMYREQRNTLERYLRRFLGSSEDAADVAQEAFLRVYAAEVGPNTTVSEGGPGQLPRAGPGRARQRLIPSRGSA